MESINLREVVKYCTVNNLYLGLGNPDAKILIVGKEIGYGHEKNKKPSSEIIEADSNKLARKNWKEWVDILLEPQKTLSRLDEHIKDRHKIFKNEKDEKEYKHMPTWVSYQKIVNGINGIKDIKIDRKQLQYEDFFLKHCFITEYSQLRLPNSNYLGKNNEIKENSINERKCVFEQDFFKNFPIVIMACGDYVTEKFIENVLGVKKDFGVNWKDKDKSDLLKGNWYDVYNNEHHKILIHTRQLSTGVSNKLLSEIAELCKHFAKL